MTCIDPEVIREGVSNQSLSPEQLAHIESCGECAKIFVEADQIDEVRQKSNEALKRIKDWLRR